MTKCKVGFVAFDHPELNHIVHAKEVQEEVIPKIKKWPLDLYIVEELPVLPIDLIKIVRNLKKNEVDIVIFYLVGYCAEGLPLVLAAELDCPIIIWSANKHPLTPLSILSYIATSRNMKHFDKKFLSVIGKADCNNTKEKIIKLCKTACLKKYLHQQTIGVIGNYNPGQVDTIVNEFQLRKLVPGILYLDTLELVKVFEEIDAIKAKNLIDVKISQIKRKKVSESVLINAMKWYLTMKVIIEKYKLDAITIRSWPELTNYKDFDRGLNASLLNEEGIVCIQEVDISATITALILQHLTKTPTFCGEIRSLEEKAFVLYHAGEAAFSLAESFKDIALFPSDNNVTVDLQITLKPGRITMAKITAFPGENTLKMFISTGKVIKSTDLVSRRAGALIEPDVELSKFFNVLIEEAVEHHILIVYGDVKQELINFCDITGIKKAII